MFVFFLVLSVCGVRNKVLVITQVYFYHPFTSYGITELVQLRIRVKCPLWPDYKSALNSTGRLG